MKNVAHYFAPFIIVPAGLILCDFIDKTDFIKMNPYIVGIFLFFISAIMGNITTTSKKFDCLISVTVPLSLFAFMFVIGLLDETETCSRFDFDKAVRISTQPVVLLICFGMAITTFIVSFKSFRLIKRNRE